MSAPSPVLDRPCMGVYSTLLADLLDRDHVAVAYAGGGFTSGSAETVEKVARGQAVVARFNRDSAVALLARNCDWQDAVSRVQRAMEALS